MTPDVLKQLVQITDLRVVGHEYSLVFCPKKWHVTGSPGTVNFPFKRIWIDTDLTDNQVLEILFHEVIEIIIDRFTVKDLSDHASLCALEYGISDFFKSNPAFGKLYLENINNNKGLTYVQDDFKGDNATADSPIAEGTVDEVLQKLLDKPPKEAKKKSRKGRKKSKR